MKSLKRIMALVTCSICFITSVIYASAENEIDIDTANANIGEAQCKMIVEDIVDNLENKYAGLYTFDNYDISVYETESAENGIVINVDVLADMTLIRHPKESPLIKGMVEASETIKDVEEKLRADVVINEYLQEALNYYQIPITTGFQYQVCIEESDTRSAENRAYQIYHRQDISEEETVLTEMEENEVFVEFASADDGEILLAQAMQDAISIKSRSVRYSRSAAVEYAIEHALDEPEFNATTGGSDCANFVSKCLNAGGIPVDEENDWYPSSVYGDTDYCGVNWMRTGYNRENGVVLYMSGKGYFSEVESNRANTGSIMFWNSRSHVALVTMCDGTTIKYTDHSDTAKTSVYHVYDANSMNVTFYRSDIS